LASINGRLAAADQIDIASGDIDITTTGSLDALGPIGEIQLASNNASGALIGDGLTGSGYALSNAEFGRLKAGEIAIIGDDMSALSTDMTIGTLAINAGQLYGSDGAVVFATGNRATQTPSGTLRIAGAVTATGFTPTNEVDIFADVVELDTATGSLKVSDSAGSLGGLVYIEADRVHVADNAILTKLRADPHYAGHIDDLNRPASVQRTDGVLNALGIDFEVSDAILIQNTGTALVPAGVVTSFGDNSDTEIGGDTTPPTGGREVVLNAQLKDAAGSTLTGKAAFDAAITQAKADAVADGETFGAELDPLSTFNNCVILTGVCSFSQSDPVAALSSEITVVTNATLDDSPVAPAADDSDEGEDGSSDDKDEDSDTDEGSAPITPPTPLINTRALNPNVDVVEPVSGAGNPALFGSAVNETTAQGDAQ